VCISWAIKCLILLMHGATTKFIIFISLFTSSKCSLSLSLPSFIHFTVNAIPSSSPIFNCHSNARRREKSAISLLTNKPIPQNKILLEKLLVSQLLKNCPIILCNPMFVARSTANQLASS